MQHTINTKLTYGDKVWVFSTTKFQLTEVTIISLDVFISSMNVEVKYHTTDNCTLDEQLEGRQWFKTRQAALNKIYGVLGSTADNDEEENNPHQCTCGHCEDKSHPEECDINELVRELFDTQTPPKEFSKTKLPPPITNSQEYVQFLNREKEKNSVKEAKTLSEEFDSFFQDPSEMPKVEKKYFKEPRTPIKDESITGENLKAQLEAALEKMFPEDILPELAPKKHGFGIPTHKKSELEQAFDAIFHQPEEELDQDFDRNFGEFVCSHPKPKNQNKLNALYEELFGRI